MTGTKTNERPGTRATAKHVRGSASKARRVLEWEPRVKLKDGMEQTYRWVEQRMNSR